jgi:hypothetical protein
MAVGLNPLGGNPRAGEDNFHAAFVDSSCQARLRFFACEASDSGMSVIIDLNRE